ncbi:BCS1 and AAA domain-containing protein [Aspergillus mulundensis]|uniref:P-loop containing nucleoside triphosphate hydrolase protein n=1 Tax=Aspergillus mulundensis TaxID=1810919 RepID=A0A3D8RSK9_9EURO|nr:hypothetical protein DSM5745_06793 [Aspergillus mulundensis]RDW76801.1 hypothetical protein DSM5745_06793 [Aspergillus mulundensis]
MDFVERIIGRETVFAFKLAFTVGSTVLGYTQSSIWVMLHGYAEQTCLSTVHVTDSDPLYRNVVKWMEEHVFKHRSFRSVKAVTDGQSSDGSSSRSHRRQMMIDRWLGSPPKSQAWPLDRPSIKLKPYTGSLFFTFNGKWIYFTHSTKTGVDRSETLDRRHLTLQTFGLSHHYLHLFLEEATSYCRKVKKNKVSVYRPGSGIDRCQWEPIATRPARSISTVILDSSKKEAVLADMKEYLDPEIRQWYTNHGIPYRRGYLFSGPPGTGKTSLSSALAGVFGLDIYIFSLGNQMIGESEFETLFSHIPAASIVLLEDIDVAGMALRRDGLQPATSGPPTGTAAEDGYFERAARGAIRYPPISLSTLLNAIDGVSSQEGRILIMTTNAPQDLDPALIRPGRVDMHVQFDLPSRAEFRELFCAMFTDVLSKEAIINTGNESCDAESGKVETEEFKPADLESLATLFAKALPEGKFSLADIQGFLLRHKRQPSEACVKVAAWVEEHLG